MFYSVDLLTLRNHYVFENFRVLCLYSTIGLSVFTFSSQATVVEIRTSLGNIEVNLFDETTPKTVENFLSYVNSGGYVYLVVHRSVSGFIIQSGGYEYTGTAVAGEVPIDIIETGLAVVNEPEYSNVRGTIAMAKLSNLPDSATSQWFINLSDNSANLDQQNSGFTVFGQVIGDGMQIVDDIANVSTVNFGGTFTDIPMPNYTATDFNNGVVIAEENLVLISDIVVTDETVNSAASLSPVENTLINKPSTPIDNGSSSGGGALGWFSLFAIACLRFRISKIKG